MKKSPWIRASAAALAHFSFATQALSAQAADLPRYDLDVAVEPATHGLAVEATVSFPAAYAGREVEFLLAAPLAIASSAPAVERLPLGDTRGFTGINGSSGDLVKSGRAVRYRATLPKDSPTLRLK